MRRRIYAGAAVMGMAALLCGIAVPARASHSHKNAWGAATLGAAGATGYAIAHGNAGWSLVGAGATYLSYEQWQKAMHHHHHYNTSRANYRNYRRAYYRRHHHY